MASLGTLERKTLEEVWRQKEANVRNVVAALGGNFAYTTVMTTPDFFECLAFKRAERRHHRFAWGFKAADCKLRKRHIGNDKEFLN